MHDFQRVFKPSFDFDAMTLWKNRILISIVFLPISQVSYYVSHITYARKYLGNTGISIWWFDLFFHSIYKISFDVDVVTYDINFKHVHMNSPLWWNQQKVPTYLYNSMILQLGNIQNSLDISLIFPHHRHINNDHRKAKMVKIGKKAHTSTNQSKKKASVIGMCCPLYVIHHTHSSYTFAYMKPMSPSVTVKHW